MGEPVFHPIANIWPLMGEAALADMAGDIRDHGQREPVLLHRDGRVADGRNRWLACELAGVPCRTETFDGTDKELLRLVTSRNRQRRHMDESQRAIVFQRLETLGHGGGREGADWEQDANLRLARAQVAELGNVSPRSLASAKVVNTEGDPELVAAVERGEVKVSVAMQIAKLPPKEQVELLRELAATPGGRRAIETVSNGFKTAARAERRAERETRAASAPANPVLRTERYLLHPGDFRELAATIPSGSIDAIVTDPPYPKEHWPLYANLAEVAARVLRPRGVCLVMVDPFMDDDVAPLLRRHLTKVCKLAFIMDEPTGTPGKPRFLRSVQKFDDRYKVFSNWKPVFYLVNGGAPEEFVSDVVRAGAPDKRWHPWQQSVDGFEALVRRFTVENELIFDPFACTATTGVAALHLGRRFVGAEVDPAIIDVAGERLRLAAAGLPDELPAPVEKAA